MHVAIVAAFSIAIYFFVILTLDIANNHRQAKIVDVMSLILAAILLTAKQYVSPSWYRPLECAAVAAPLAVL